jgi:hypothetical protein
MRYLNKRDEFLKNYNNILDIKKNYIPKGEELITEDGGPFHNDIGWGDSLVGRLINSTIRKVKIGANLLRIKVVEQRLRDAMDELLLTTSVAEMDEEDKKLYARALITTYLAALEEAVKNGSPIDELKGLTEAAISAVEMNDELEDKNELLRQLNEWLKFLNNFKEEEAQEESSEGSEGAMSATESYLANFKNLYNILLIYKGIEKERLEQSRQAVMATKSGASASTPTTTTTTTTTTDPAQGATQIGVKNGVKTGVNDSILLKYDDFKRMNEGVGKGLGTVAGKIWKFFTGGVDEKEVEKAEYKDTKNLWDTIQPLYKIFEAEKGVLEKDSEMHRFLKLTPEQIQADPKLKLVYNKYKSNIDKIYTFVRSANGITEGAHELLGRNEEIGKRIAAIYAVTKSKPDGKFIQYPGTVGEAWDELVENIAGFNKYMKNVFEVESKWKVGDTVTWKSETTGNSITQEILRIDGKKLVFKDKKGEEYTKFMSEVEKVKESVLYNKFGKIYEAQEDAQEDTQSQDEEENDGVVSAWKNPNSVTRIQDWWGKNMDLKRWMLEKTEVEKVRVNLEKKLAEKRDSVVINGMDPVLEIVKVFNRAYKLHTTQVIPSGRSGGKVSNKTFMEYHCFGSGSPANAGEGGGPYRNNAIFNQWEDCVNDVKKDKRYQCIFNVGTRIKVGNEYIEKAGMNLRKFMTDMLDGDELYKSSGGQGAQAKFLDKYFGYKDGDKEAYFAGDKDSINEVANQIKPIKMDVLAGNSALAYDNTDDLKNTFFSLRLKDKKDNTSTQFFYIQDIKDNIAYLTYSMTAFHMINYIKKSKGDIKVESKFQIKDVKNDTTPYAIRATTIPLDKLYKKDGALALGTSISITPMVKKTELDRATNTIKVDNSLTNREYELEEEKIYTIVGANHIIDLEDNSKRVSASESGAGSVMAKHGGYEKITTIDNIRSAKMENN